MATKKTVAKKSDPKLVKNVKRRVAVVARAAVTAQIKEMAERPSERAMREVSEVTAVVAGTLRLSAAVVDEAKALQLQKKDLEAELEALSARLKEKEQAIIAALDAGLEPESGCRAVVVERTPRINPKWKDEAISLAKESGRNIEIYEAGVRARTTPVIITRLVINGDVKKS